jgi:hypothetical protein
MFLLIKRSQTNLAATIFLDCPVFDPAGIFQPDFGPEHVENWSLGHVAST